MSSPLKSVGDPQASSYSILHRRLWITQNSHAESDDANILARTWTDFSNVDLTSLSQWQRTVFLDGGANIFQGPPSSEGPYPIFIPQFSLILPIGAFLKSCQSSPRFTFVSNGANAVKSISKAFTVMPDVLPPEVIKGQGVGQVLNKCH